MGFKVKLKMSKDSINRVLSNAIEEKRAAIIQTLLFIGESCVNDARLNGSYTDRTGNLRSSIGYRVIDNGTVVGSGGFKRVKDGEQGASKGSRYIDAITERYANFSGLVLVVVAGMNYASYVADRGYNVLQSAELVAEGLVNDLIGKK